MKVDIFNADKKYDVIYADPPWAYKQGGGEITRCSKQALQHHVDNRNMRSSYKGYMYR